MCKQRNGVLQIRKKLEIFMRKRELSNILAFCKEVKIPVSNIPSQKIFIRRKTAINGKFGK